VRLLTLFANRGYELDKTSYMASSTLMLETEIGTDKKFEARFQSCIKEGRQVLQKKSPSAIISAVLWQPEGVAWPTVVLPLHVQVFSSCCFLTSDYRVSMKKRIINDLKNKLKAIEVSNTALYCAFKCVQRVIPAGVFISCDFGN
jgi:uncharacterized protein YecE (DUF72 family)